MASSEAEKYFIYQLTDYGTEKELGETTALSYDASVGLLGQAIRFAVKAWSTLDGFSDRSSYDDGHKLINAPTNLTASDGEFPDRIRVYVDPIPEDKQDNEVVCKLYRAIDMEGPYQVVLVQYGLLYGSGVFGYMEDIDDDPLSENVPEKGQVYYYKATAFTEYYGNQGWVEYESDFSNIDTGYR